MPDENIYYFLCPNSLFAIIFSRNIKVIANMKIGINLLPYTGTSHGGSEIYLRSVADELSKNANNKVVIIEKVKNCMLLKMLKKRSLRVFAEQIILPRVIKKNNIDCLISNYVGSFFVPCPQIVIVHDMLYQRYPEVFERLKLLYWKIMIPISIRYSSAVGTVSQFSADEIAYFYGANKKLFVTVEGIRQSLMGRQVNSLPVPMYNFKYLLCVATFGKHKNLNKLVQAFAGLPPSHSDVSIVFVGAARTPDAIEYKASLKELVVSLGVDSRVIFEDHVLDEKLASLYKGALALVLPSLYEGFGLPIIEAQYWGCPVLCSNIASMPEIAGEGALTFNPHSINSIRNTISLLLSHPEMGEQLRSNGYNNVEQFSWEKAASQIMTSVERVVALKGK
jgi:glycosyltransferase involved in cell wall biosynthesis